jgi:hypothetical protein
MQDQVLIQSSTPAIAVTAARYTALTERAGVVQGQDPCVEGPHGVGGGFLGGLAHHGTVLDELVVVALGAVLGKEEGGEGAQHDHGGGHDEGHTPRLLGGHDLLVAVAAAAVVVQVCVCGDVEKGVSDAAGSNFKFKFNYVTSTSTSTMSHLTTQQQSSTLR